MNMLFDDTQHTLLETNLDAGTLTNFQLEYPDSGSTVCSFAALVQNMSESGDLESQIQSSVTLKVSGQATKV
jgi:hypothetical protein